MLDSPESATLAVTIIPVSRVGGVATPGCLPSRAPSAVRLWTLYAVTLTVPQSKCVMS